MIFAIGEDGVVEVHSDIASVRMHCEGIDVESGVWEFFDAAGAPLEPVFRVPNVSHRLFRKVTLVDSGIFDLVPKRGGPSPTLLESLTEGLQLDPNPHFASLEALRACLEQRRVT